MSIGFLTEEQTPMIWRGPMVTSAIKTFAQKVSWNNLDFIVVDCFYCIDCFFNKVDKVKKVKK